jgi:hypothetical protein
MGWYNASLEHLQRASPGVQHAESRSHRVDILTSNHISLLTYKHTHSIADED